MSMSSSRCMVWYVSHVMYHSGCQCLHNYPGTVHNVCIIIEHGAHRYNCYPGHPIIAPWSPWIIIDLQLNILSHRIHTWAIVNFKVPNNT